MRKKTHKRHKRHLGIKSFGLFSSEALSCIDVKLDRCDASKCLKSHSVVFPPLHLICLRDLDRLSQGESKELIDFNMCPLTYFSALT